MSEFTLYNYYRSSSSYRVRIALHLKSIAFQYVPVHLLQDGGDQNKLAFRRLSPRGEVPLLVHNQMTLSQSMAIIQYLDAIEPNFPLFPQKPEIRAQILQFCEDINSGIQPLQNLRVISELRESLNASDQDVNHWLHHWIEAGFSSLEATLAKTAGTYCFGGEVTAADLFLVPQVFSARRFDVSLSSFPILERVATAAGQLKAFQNAHPDRQIDAPRIQ